MLFQDIHKDNILSVTAHSNCIVTSWPDKCCLSHGMCLYQVIMTLHFLNDIVNDIESTKIGSYVIIVSLNSELINILCTISLAIVLYG